MILSINLGWKTYQKFAERIIKLLGERKYCGFQISSYGFEQYIVKYKMSVETIYSESENFELQINVSKVVAKRKLLQ